ncbi:GNAT family N-acetyltransferase [Sphaerisporangium sp. NPDC051011]|uniref:GNAT family N-acetyltransferase n=1 Tax=Sphaerisporangium sp. NPDC051011 TaxID=3155792 RepID=UPI003400203A
MSRARDHTPFLHTVAGNRNAIRRYEYLGFRLALPAMTTSDLHGAQATLADLFDVIDVRGQHGDRCGKA